MIVGREVWKVWCFLGCFSKNYLEMAASAIFTSEAFVIKSITPTGRLVHRKTSFTPSDHHFTVTIPLPEFRTSSYITAKLKKQKRVEWSSCVMPRKNMCCNFRAHPSSSSNSKQALQSILRLSTTPHLFLICHVKASYRGHFSIFLKK